MQADTASLAIGGMRCAACAQLIEFRLQQLPGVAECRIDVLQHSAQLRFDARQTSLRQIMDAVGNLGYRALPLSKKGDVAAMDAALAKQALWRLFIAGFAMMQVMMFAFPAYLQPVPQIDGDLTPDIDHLLKLASLVLTLPVMLFSARPFFASAWRDWQNRHVGMDLPVAIGIGATFAASVWATFRHGPVYYDSVVMFVFLLLGARWLEARVQARSGQALRALTELAPAMAERYHSNAAEAAADSGVACALAIEAGASVRILETGAGAGAGTIVGADTPATAIAFGGREIEIVPVAEIRLGDVLRVRPGSQFAVDGIIVEGVGSVDEALMTGEAHALSKGVGDAVLAGALNLTGMLAVRATRVGGETQFAALLQMMHQAAQHKPRLVQLADRHASRFLLLVLLLSVCAGLFWWQRDASRALMIAISVMVVTCPCALSLATPGVMAAALGQMAQHGVLVVRGSALESMARATHFVFDKTGTLTTGQLQLLEQHWLVPDAGALAAVAQLAAGSLHPVAQALARGLPPPDTRLPALESVQELAGEGMQAIWQGRSIRLGRAGFVQAGNGAAAEIAMLTDKTPDPIADDASMVYVGVDGELLGWFILQDQLRPDARELIASLQAEGKQVHILSGDRPEVVASMAATLGLPAWQAQGGLLPQQKYRIVQQMQQGGAVVAMIGDGMNDGPVLSLADVSIAMGHGAPISQARSDVVLISSRLADLQYALQVATFGLKLIRQNLGWAVLYNLLAIPAAMAGILAPWQAALGMSLSSLWVVGNALRVLRLQPETGQSRPNFPLVSQLASN